MMFRGISVKTQLNKITMKTADLVDHYQDQLQSCALQLKNFGGKSAFWGPCRTVTCNNDNVLARKMLEQQGDGQVLVIDGGGSLRTALMGDIIASIAQTNKWAGVVIHGVIRDTVAISAIDLGVKALGSNPMKSRKEGLGEIDKPVSFGGLNIKPGDWLYSDEDGIVVAGKELPLDF